VNRTGILTEEPEPLVATADVSQKLIPSPTSMPAILFALLATVRSSVRSRVELEAKILGFRRDDSTVNHTATDVARNKRIRQIVYVVIRLVPVEIR
jgi:hypothetical protein